MSDVANAGIWLASASLSFLEGAGVVGALVTGTLSDRMGRRRILAILLTVSPALMLVFIHSPSWMAIPLLIALGLTAISPAPVLLASVQDEFPHHRALANGVYLATNFLIRAAGVWLLGVFADRFELVPAFTWSAIIALLSLPAIRFLPWKDQRESP
jgi:FSR family fosmidomycin resistance protein-like MFS transporter